MLTTVLLLPAVTLVFRTLSNDIIITFSFMIVRLQIIACDHTVKTEWRFGLHAFLAAPFAAAIVRHSR